MAANASAPILPENEELFDVEGIWILGQRRSALHQSEAGDTPGNSDEKRNPPIRLRPVERKAAVSESPVRPHFEPLKDIAQVVDVELEEIGEQRRVGLRRNIQCDDIG